MPREPLDGAGARAGKVVPPGKSLSRQSYALGDRIFEVAEIAGSDHRIIEVHPEVGFRALRGEPLRYSKHTWSGIAERRTLLAAAGILLPDNLPGGGHAAPDDVVDAAVAAWSAMRAAQSRSSTLPAEPSGDPGNGGVIHYLDMASPERDWSDRL